MEEYSKALSRLQQDLAAFKPAAEHLVADLALRGFMLDVEENATVAADIAAGTKPHRAFPNARAAFEAAQLSYLLVTDSNYNLAGARAWVYHLRKDRDFALLEGHDAMMGDQEVGELTPDNWYSAAVNEIADIWESFSPGKGAIVLQAKEIVDRQPRKPDNWAGVPVDKELGRRLREQAAKSGSSLGVDSPESAQKRAYAALSRSTHPRPSLRPKRITRSIAGALSIEFESPNTDLHIDMINMLLAGSINFGIGAVHTRFQMGAA